VTSSDAPTAAGRATLLAAMSGVGSLAIPRRGAGAVAHAMPVSPMSTTIHVWRFMCGPLQLPVV
jgi:hypothetical protein